MDTRKRPRLFLIDGTALAFRAFYAFIHNPLRRKSDGVNVSAVYGVASSLLKIRREEEPDYWVFTFDRSEPTFRHEMFSEYKATREEIPEELVEQLPQVKEAAASLGCRLVELAGYEADDLIATLARRAVTEDFDVVIVSGDKDLMQLVTDRITIYNSRKAGSEIERLDPAGVERKFGVPPDKVRDVLALMGDASDNVPGVPGIGPKTAVQLIGQYGDLESTLAAAAEVKRPALREKLREYADQARLSLELVTLRDDCKVAWEPERWRVAAADDREAARFFDAMEMRSLIRSLSPEAAADTDEAKVDMPVRRTQACPGIGDSFGAAAAGNYQCVRTPAELRKLVKQMQTADWVAVDTETTSLSTLDAELVGISLSWAEAEAYYIPVGHDAAQDNLPLAEVLEILRPVLTGRKPRLVAQNVKYDAEVFARYGIALSGIGFDPMLASYCLNPSARAHGLDALAREHCGHTMQPISELIGKGAKQKSFATVPVAVATHYAAEDADYTRRLVGVLAPKLKPAGVDRLFEEIELPLAPVLGRMERAGVRVDTAYLKRLSRRMQKSVDTLIADIYDAAGEEFNLNSPVQLAQVLFDRLKLTPSRRTAKTSQHTTDMAVLEKLAAEHEVPRLMLEYRQLTKLKSTYVDALIGLVHPKTGRVHTSFQQAVTATGRLSSSDPNLQNIPVRTEEGRKIRRAFVPRDKDHELLVVDYSQIELRLMAHFSEDPALVAAFRDADDVHARTAAQIFGVVEEAVTPEQRRLAKTANFGIIYGVSAFGLSQQSDMTIGEARAFIDTYFQRYPGVKRYIVDTVKRAREDGMVRTLFGRRRFLPDIASSNRQRREFAERTAVNTPMQGTAADIIKKAMIVIDERLRADGARSVMTLQVHDELVFDAHRSETKRLARLVKETMETVVDLRVPLVADVGIGPNWLEAK